MGLFEKKKLNWFEDSYWETIGYKMERFEKREVHLSREPIRRFEDLDVDDFPSMIIQKTTKVNSVIEIIKKIKSTHITVEPHDIAIIILDDKKSEALAVAEGDNLSLAIGKKGQNVKLAARLTKCKIDVKTREQVQEEGINIYKYYEA